METILQAIMNRLQQNNHYSLDSFLIDSEVRMWEVIYGAQLLLCTPSLIYGAWILNFKFKTPNFDLQFY